MNRPWLAIAPLILLLLWSLLPDGGRARAGEPAARVYQNRLTPIENPPPLLADYPEFVEPVQDVRRFESPRLIDDPAADLSVRGWRFSYNARGIIEVPNRLDASKTAVIVVHPWGIDDQQGWTTPEPAGVAFACTPEKNALMHKHAEQVVNPLLERLRSQVGLVMYSLPGGKDAVRGKMYRSFDGTPTREERESGKRELLKMLRSFDYTGSPLPEQLPLTSGKPAIDYFQHFPGLDAGDLYNNAGFWKLPIPVMEAIDVHPGDVVIYDAEGYAALKTFMQDAGIEHVLLCGYHADMCVCKTTAGYENLRRDFNVFLVGDAVQSTFPANTTARHATNQTVSFAALELFITQASWIRHDDDDAVARASSRRQGPVSIERTASGSTNGSSESATLPSRDAADYRWVNVTSKAAFAPRDGAGALVFKGRMWLLGGWNPSDKQHFPRICNNEVWSSADGAAWTLEKPNTFLDRSFDPQSDWEGRHTAGYAVYKDKMWIVGGDVNQGHYHSDVWSSPDGKLWTRVNQGRDVPWGPRALHHTLVFNDRMWVMGGQTIPQFAAGKESFHRDIWTTSDGVEWEQVQPQEPYWSARGMIGGSAVFQGRMWILGGGTYDTPGVPERKFYNDVWSSADGVRWQRHVEHAPWEPRQYHEVAVFDDRLWVLEGYHHSNRNDVWHSSDGVDWHELPDTPWAPRHTASVFVHDGALWMVAGNNMQPDVWKLQRRGLP
ncbi:MAG: isochorismatase family protein [Pirellulales bacterium]